MELTNNISFLKESHSIVVYGGKAQFSAGIMQGAVGSYKKSSVAKNLKIASWYDDSKNGEPESILNTLLSNNVAPAILDTKAKFIVGDGLICYEEVLIEGKKDIRMMDIPEINEWIEQTDMNEQLFRAAKDAQYFGNAFFEFVFRDDKKVSIVNHRDATTIRAEQAAEDGDIHAYYLCGNWAKAKYVAENEKEGNVNKLNAYISMHPDEKKVNWVVNNLFPKCIYQVREYVPGFPYYSLPAWYGTKKWIELANVIPAWHLAGITNGYSLRYLIEVSEAYFARFTSEEQVQAAKKKLQDDLNACLSGAENAGKTIFAVMNQQNFADKGIIRITPIASDLHDEAFSTLFQHSNTATTSGFAIHPTLCSIETEGKLSSGSEMRNAYELWMKLHAVRPRQILIQVMNAVKKINGWDTKYPTMKFGFQNVQLTTVDVNPTATQHVIA